MEKGTGLFKSFFEAVLSGARLVEIGRGLVPNLVSEGIGELVEKGIELAKEKTKQAKLYREANKMLLKLQKKYDEDFINELFNELLSLGKDEKREKPVRGKDFVKYLLGSLEPLDEDKIRGLKCCEGLPSEEVDEIAFSIMSFKSIIYRSCLNSMDTEQKIFIQVLAERLSKDFGGNSKSHEEDIVKGLYRYEGIEKCPYCRSDFSNLKDAERSLITGVCKCEKCNKVIHLKPADVSPYAEAAAYLSGEIDKIDGKLDQIIAAVAVIGAGVEDLKQLEADAKEERKELSKKIDKLDRNGKKVTRSIDCHFTDKSLIFVITLVLAILLVAAVVLFCIFTFRDKTLKDKAMGVTAVAEFSDFGFRKSGVKLKVAEITPENADFGAVANMLSAHHAEGVAYEAYSISFVRRNGTLADLKRKSDGIDVTIPLDEGFIHKQNTKAYILSETEQPLALDADLTSSTLRFNTSGIDISEVIIVCIQEPFAVSFEGLAEETQYLWYGEKATLPEAIPAKVGYSFAKWGVKEGEEIKPFDFSAEAIKSGTQLVPIFTPLSYTVTIEGEEEITVTFDRPYTLPQAQATEGYHLVGYYDEQGRKIAQEGVWTIPENCTLTPVFEANVYQILYDPNGGQGATPTSTHVFDTEAPLSENGFTRVGYEFVGYSKSKNSKVPEFDSGEPITNLSSVNGDTVTLYAVWQPITYQIAYDPNKGEGTVPNSTHVFDTESPLSENEFTRVGYEFVGYSKSKNSKVPEFESEELVSNLSSVNGDTVTLYAVWQPITYKIVYHSNNGESVTEESTHVFDASKELRANTFSKRGCHFVGWGSSPVDSDSIFTDCQSVSNLASEQDAVVNLYAQYSANTYQIKYVLSGGEISGEYATSYLFGTSVELPTNVTKENYIFAGWYDGSGNESNFYTKVTNDDIDDKTFYCHWVENKVYSTFAEGAEYEAVGKTKPYEVEGSGKSSFVIDVPEELRNMLSTGRLRVRITVNSEAALKYCARKRQDIHADASLNVSIGGTAFEEILALTAYGKGGDVGPIYGDEVTGLNSLTVSLALNKASNILELDYQYKVDFKDYTWFFFGEEYPRKVDFSFALNNLSYVFYVE